MQLTLCRHIKTNGTRCQAPLSPPEFGATSTTASSSTTPAFRPTAATRGYLIPGQHIELSALEDPESVQVALSGVINALATGQLDIKRATALLYGLQLASSNARGLQTKLFAPDVVRTIESSPEGLDLAEPGTTPETENLYSFNGENEGEDDEENDKKEEFTEEPTTSLKSTGTL